MPENSSSGKHSANSLTLSNNKSSTDVIRNTKYHPQQHHSPIPHQQVTCSQTTSTCEFASNAPTAGYPFLSGYTHPNQNSTFSYSHLYPGLSRCATSGLNSSTSGQALVQQQMIQPASVFPSSNDLIDPHQTTASSSSSSSSLAHFWRPY